MSDEGEGAQVVGAEPTRNPERVYLDSCFYLDYLKGDTPHHGALQRVFDAWNDGEIEVATSALTISEVLWVKCDEDGARMLVDRAREDDLLDLFAKHGKRRFILVEVQRTVAEKSRNLVWDHNIKPKDAIHIASALTVDSEVMFTTDKGLLKHSGKLDGPLHIKPPAWIVQATLMGDEQPSEVALPGQPSLTEDSVDP